MFEHHSVNLIYVFPKIAPYMSIYLCDFGTKKSKITNFWASSFRKLDVLFPQKNKYRSIYLCDFGINKSKILDIWAIL